MLLIEIEQSNSVHTNKAGEAFLRIGDESRKLSPEQHRQLLYDKGEQQYEEEIADGLDIAELDEPSVTRLGQRLDIRDDTVRLLQARHLARKDRSGELGLTFAGAVLLHRTRRSTSHRTAYALSALPGRRPPPVNDKM